MRRSKKSLFNAMLASFLSASMVLTTPVYAVEFSDGQKVTVNADTVKDDVVKASKGG